MSSSIFADIPKDDFPAHESLKDLVQRTVPYWVQNIEPELRAGKRILVVAHGTSLRGVIKHVKNLVRFFICCGVPNNGIVRNSNDRNVFDCQVIWILNGIQNPDKNSRFRYFYIQNGMSRDFGFPS